MWISKETRGKMQRRETVREWLHIQALLSAIRSADCNTIQ